MISILVWLQQLSSSTPQTDECQSSVKCAGVSFFLRPCSRSEASAFNQGLQLHNKEMEVSLSRDNGFVSASRCASRDPCVDVCCSSLSNSPVSDGAAPSADLISSRGFFQTLSEVVCVVVHLFSGATTDEHSFWCWC